LLQRQFTKEDTKIPPAPVPWKARAKMRNPKLGETADKSDPISKIKTAKMNI
jgi:hypothetical protein